jgi:hypothetical protein
MDEWRRRAVEAFPRLKADLEDPEYSTYQLFFDLGGELKDAYRNKNNELMEAIYSYAEWALSRREKDLWNAAAVAFYESLYDGRLEWADVTPRMSRFVVYMIRDLWEERLGTEKWAKLSKELEDHLKGSG